MVNDSEDTPGRKPGAGAGLFDSDLAATVKNSAQQIWLAGLGAFSKAQEEGGKVFDALVKEGAGLQRKTQAAAEEKISEVTGRMGTMADDVQAKAGQQWGKLESIFEDRTAKAMSRLGVPTKQDLEAVIARVDQLSAKIDRLMKRSVPVKPAVKRAARKAQPR